MSEMFRFKKTITHLSVSFSSFLLYLGWPTPALSEQVPVAPEVSEWKYTGIRCETEVPYPSEEAAIQAGVARYNRCGDASVASRGVWGTATEPVKGACGSSNDLPAYSLGVERRNARHISISYCNTHDSWTIFRTRTVRCPSGYTFSSNQCIPVGEDVAKAPSQCKPELGIAFSGNPINLSSRSKQESIIDLTIEASKGWFFRRYYSSREHYYASRMNKHWRHTFERRLVETQNSAIRSVTLYRDDGQALRFSLTNGLWKADGDINYLLSSEKASDEAIRWQVITPDNETEVYDEHGSLLQVTDRHHQTISLTYDANRWIKKISYPNGTDLLLTYHANGLLKMVKLSNDINIIYEYNSNNLLTNATHSIGGASVMHYEDSRFPTALTGITDERGVRFQTWAYDDQGRPVLSEHAEGAERTRLTYHSDGKITVTNALEKQSVYSFKLINGLNRLVSVDGVASLNCVGANRAYTYTPDGRLESKTDWKGHLTTYTYNDRGLEISRTEAAGTPQARTVTTEW
ncbi:DUF6531 domain-containing protein, partial [Pseudomonas sp. PIC25]|uniref:DUF6531 domain-containing protein n=1 Tax=Pseudomonas sp. PIC25 TaxID=1958773 RepID=UPI00117BADB3